MNYYYQTDQYGYPMENHGYPMMGLPRGDERIWGSPWGWGPWGFGGFGGPFFRPWGFGFPFFPFFW